MDIVIRLSLKHAKKKSPKIFLYIHILVFLLASICFFICIRILDFLLATDLNCIHVSLESVWIRLDVSSRPGDYMNTWSISWKSKQETVAFKLEKLEGLFNFDHPFGAHDSDGLDLRILQ